MTDRPGRVLTPGVMYDDARGADRVDRVRSAGAGLWDRLGHRPGPTWALPTLIALRDEYPDAARVAHQGDVVNAWLTGRPSVATDTSTALKTGYDTERRCWPTGLLAGLRLDPDLFPDVVDPGTLIGEVGAPAAERTGLRAGTPVLAGTTDGCAAQLGAGAVTPGAWHSVLGTTLVLKGVARAPVRDPEAAVYSHRSPVPGWWLPGGASNTGAAVLDRFVPRNRFDAVTRRLLDRPPRWIPVAYPLPGRGERFPVTDPDAEGFWLDAGGNANPLSALAGMTDEVTAFAALADGVAFVERWCFERLGELGADLGGPRTVSGGATANPWWNRRRADLLGVPLHLPATAEPAFGMAVLAAAATGGTGRAGDGLEAAGRRMCHTTSTVEPRPDPALADRYAMFAEALGARYGTRA
ncbi:MAG: FGGY-family carbohydrate kinase [Actinomycetota bacterium]|nr:FGGY-family carbohydrate kinase [Actinomycetota bacterium]